MKNNKTGVIAFIKHSLIIGLAHFRVDKKSTVNTFDKRNYEFIRKLVIAKGRLAPTWIFNYFIPFFLKLFFNHFDHSAL